MPYPLPLQKLIDAFKTLPGVGPRTAERYAFAFLKLSPPQRKQFADAVGDTHSIKRCAQCNNLSNDTMCAICTDPRRNPQTICIVADTQDLTAIERMGEFNGVYHVLGGLLSPLEGTSPKDLKIDQILERIKIIRTKHCLTPSDAIELILAFDQTPEGESTAIYIAKELMPAGAIITRLAKGLPTGSDLNYADDLTLSSALSGRKAM